jgi:hypothetical protein
MRNALLVLSALSLTTLFACAPQPASMTLAGSEAVEVHTLDAVALPQVNLLDASGNPIADTSKVTITWAVADAAVAKIEADKVVPLASGESDVTATAGALTASFKLKVSVPDELQLPTADTSWTVGQTRPVPAKVLAKGNAVEGLTVTWTSSNEAVATVDATGAVTGKTPGEATITAAHNELKATLNIVVSEGAAAEVVEGAAQPAPGAM